MYALPLERATRWGGLFADQNMFSNTYIYIYIYREICLVNKIVLLSLYLWPMQVDTVRKNISKEEYQ